eukprot:54288_1
MLTSLFIVVSLVVVVLRGQMQQKFKQQIGSSYERKILVNNTTKKWKNREKVYLWNIVCVEENCNISKWNDRMTWAQYSNGSNKHYNQYHKLTDPWANGNTAGKVASIMEHIKVVSVWVLDVDETARNIDGKQSYKEYRFVEEENLCYIQDVEAGVIDNDLQMNDLQMNDDNSNNRRRRISEAISDSDLNPRSGPIRRRNDNIAGDVQNSATHGTHNRS